MKSTLIVARQELLHHLRDTRTLASNGLYAAMGPGVVLLVSLSNAGDRSRRAALLLSMASVFALVTAASGGMSLAMDTMAGERERRSLVPLLLTPVSRLHLVLGKWIAVCAIGLGALSVTLCGCLVVVWWQAPVGWIVLAQLGVWALFGLVPLALAGSALHLLLAARSRTAQEAHGWHSIAMFLPMLAGMFLVFFPAWIGGWWFLAPVIGQQAIVVRSLAGQPVSVPEAALLAIATIAAIVPALLATRRALERDDVLSG
jgi:sodium transport system permease protein